MRFSCRESPFFYSKLILAYLSDAYGYRALVRGEDIWQSLYRLLCSYGLLKGLPVYHLIFAAVVSVFCSCYSNNDYFCNVNGHLRAAFPHHGKVQVSLLCSFGLRKRVALAQLQGVCGIGTSRGFVGKKSEKES